MASAGVKVCWGPDKEDCVALAHRLWRSSGVPGELSQELRSPAHFDQASQLVTPDAVAEHIPCGPAIEPIVDAVKKYVDAGFDRVFVNQIGPRQREFFEFYQRELAAALAEISAGSPTTSASR